MSPDPLTPDARRENATSLAALVGIDQERAAEELDLCILVTADPDDAVADKIADETVRLLARTVERVIRAPKVGVIATEIVIGRCKPQSGAPKVYVDVSAERAVIGRVLHAPARTAVVPPIIGLVVACYASGVGLSLALSERLSLGSSDPLTVDFSQLGMDLRLLSLPIELGHAYLAGAGAIGNGLLWAARTLDIRGQLDIVDDDRVSSGNLNRQIWFDTEDINLFKAERLAARAASFFPALKLEPRVRRLQGLPEREGPWLSRLISAVDSRRARRALQNEFPGEVFDASTTDIREIVIHHNRQPTTHACMSCIYQADEEEFSHEQHVADHLGVSVLEVRTERISLECAAIIAARYPVLRAADIIGVAYDTLFKQLCSEGELKTLEGKRVIAPFAFVSVLAGALLAIELARRLAKGVATPADNYWRLSPWHPPFARRRILRPRQRECVFCGDPVLKSINAQLWP